MMLQDYSRIDKNKQSINNFNEGITDTNNHDDRLSYVYNEKDPQLNPHGEKLSLACQSGTDMLHTVGNVTAIGLQFILDQFPPNTFATALPSVRLAHRQLRHTPTSIRTQNYPICVVNPRASLDANDGRLGYGTFALSNWSSTSNRFQNRSEMEELLFDKQNGIRWLAKINRTVVFLDFVLSFRTIAEQLNWASYFINRIPTNGFFDIETALEMAIPDGFLNETSRYAKIPVKDENGNVSRFVDYLNMNSVFPISYRFSSGRHKDAFYSYYMTTILCSISEFSYSNVSKTGVVDGDCPITFTMRCEFNTVGMYDLCVPNPGPFRYIQPPTNAITIPIFSDVFNEKDFPLEYGWKIHSRPLLKLDWGETSIDLKDIFSPEINHLIDYHIEHHINPEIMLCVKLRENKYLIEEGYYVDWKQRKLIFTMPNYAITYRLLIVINKLYMNNLLTELYGK